MVEKVDLIIQTLSDNVIKALKESIQEHREVRKALTEAVKKVCQSEAFPLDARWDIFVESGLGDHSYYYHEPSGINWTKYTLYDDFYCDRYQTINAVELLELAQDKEIIKQGSEEERRFKEYFLKEFIYSFTHDW